MPMDSKWVLERMDEVLLLGPGHQVQIFFVDPRNSLVDWECSQFVIQREDSCVLFLFLLWWLKQCGLWWERCTTVEGPWAWRESQMMKVPSWKLTIIIIFSLEAKGIIQKLLTSWYFSFFWCITIFCFICHYKSSLLKFAEKLAPWANELEKCPRLEV